MQCIAAAFPDEFHVGTLEALLDILPSLQPGVRLATVMGSLLDRLARYDVCLLWTWASECKYPFDKIIWCRSTMSL